MSTPREALDALSSYVRELDQLSKDLAGVERDLQPVETDVQAFTDDYELGLWTKHVEESAKLPSADLRAAMVRRAMDPGLYGRHTALVASRKRMEKRIASLKAAADAQRSILSALRTEQEAAR